MEKERRKKKKSPFALEIILHSMVLGVSKKVYPKFLKTFEQKLFLKRDFKFFGSFETQTKSSSKVLRVEPEEIGMD